jgi:hypothetical protein
MSLTKSELVRIRNVIKSFDGTYEMTGIHLEQGVRMALSDLTREIECLEKPRPPTPMLDAMKEWDDKYLHIINGKYDTYEEYSEAVRDIPARPSSIAALKEVKMLLTEGEEPVEKTKEIAEALSKGGLIYAPRSSGKTKALAQILKQDPNAVVFCDQQAQRDRLVSFDIVDKQSVNNLPFKSRVFINTETYRNKFALSQIAKIYIDEWTPGVEYPPFFAAVTSKVTVV